MNYVNHLIINQYLHPTIVTALRHDPIFHIEGRQECVEKTKYWEWGLVVRFNATSQRKLAHLLLFGTHSPTYQTALCKTTRLL